MDKLISERMVLCRLLLDKNQSDVAQMIGFKGPAALSKIEKCQVKIRVEVADKIANALNCHPDWLLTGKTNRNRHQYLIGSHQLSHFNLQDAAWKTTVPLKFVEAVFDGEVSPSDNYYIQLCAALRIPPNETYADDLDAAIEKQKTSTTRVSEISGPPPYGYSIVPEDARVEKLRTQLDTCYERCFDLQEENRRLREEVERLRGTT